MIQFLKRLFGLTDPPIQAYLDGGAVVIDVRNLDEYEKDHIKDALLIPLPELYTNIEKIKNINKQVIVYCRSGRRSGIAAKVLRKNKIDAVNGGGLKDMRKYLD